MYNPGLKWLLVTQHFDWMKPYILSTFLAVMHVELSSVHHLVNLVGFPLTCRLLLNRILVLWMQIYIFFQLFLRQRV